MNELAQDIRQLLVRELDGIRRELSLFPDEETVWRVMPGVSNSAGTLVRHVTGNLRHFVGTVLGGSSYRRDRAAEFGAHPCSRAQLDTEVDATILTVREVLPQLTEQAMKQPFPVAVHRTLAPHTQLFLLHLCTHAAYHLGQIGYLRRVLTGENQPSDALSVESLS